MTWAVFYPYKVFIPPGEADIKQRILQNILNFSLIISDKGRVWFYESV